MTSCSCRFLVITFTKEVKLQNIKCRERVLRERKGGLRGVSC